MGLFLLIALLTLLVLGVLGVYLGIKYDLRVEIEPAKSVIRKYYFLFRWFLIGRYYCDLPKPQILFISTLNKLFWGIVCVLSALGVAHICGIVKAILGAL